MAADPMTTETAVMLMRQRDELAAELENTRRAVRALEGVKVERDRYREALEWIVDHSQEFTQEIHGYTGYGQALAAVHSRARREVEPPAPSTAENEGRDA